MKWIIALAALLTAAVVMAQNNTRWSTAIPPERFQGPALVPVAFVPPNQITTMCNTKPPEGIRIIACTTRISERSNLIVMPDPCIFAEQEFYARVMCHEISHAAHGWTGEHES